METRLKRKTDSPSNTIGELFAIRDMAHLLHLRTTSYAAHVALGDYYGELLGHIDALAEGYQSEGLLDITIPSISISGMTPQTFIKNVYIKVEEMREKCMHNWAINIYDDILTLTAGTMYKLNHLK